MESGPFHESDPDSEDFASEVTSAPIVYTTGRSCSDSTSPANPEDDTSSPMVPLLVFFSTEPVIKATHIDAVHAPRAMKVNTRMFMELSPPVH